MPFHGCRNGLYGISSNETPFGGSGISGIGLQNGIHGVRDMQLARGVMQKLRRFPLLNLPMPRFLHDNDVLYTVSEDELQAFRFMFRNLA